MHWNKMFDNRCMKTRLSAMILVWTVLGCQQPPKEEAKVDVGDMNRLQAELAAVKDDRARMQKEIENLQAQLKSQETLSALIESSFLNSPKLGFTSVTFIHDLVCCDQEATTSGVESASGFNCVTKIETCKSWVESEQKKAQVLSAGLSELAKSHTNVKPFLRGWRVANLIVSHVSKLKGHPIRSLHYNFMGASELVATVELKDYRVFLVYLRPDKAVASVVIQSAAGTLLEPVEARVGRNQILIRFSRQTNMGCDIPDFRTEETVVWNYATDAHEIMAVKNVKQDGGGKGCLEGAVECTPLLATFNPLEAMPDQWCVETCEAHATECPPKTAVGDPSKYIRLVRGNSDRQ